MIKNRQKNIEPIIKKVFFDEVENIPSSINPKIAYENYHKQIIERNFDKILKFGINKYAHYGIGMILLDITELKEIEKSNPNTDVIRLLEYIQESDFVGSIGTGWGAFKNIFKNYNPNTESLLLVIENDDESYSYILTKEDKENLGEKNE